MERRNSSILTTQTWPASFSTQLKRYKNIYGFSGTLGSEEEKLSLEKIYHVDLVKIPTAKVKNFIEEKATVVNTDNKWVDEIGKAIVSKLKERRSVLVIGDCPNSVKAIDEGLKMRANSDANYHGFSKTFRKIEPYMRDYQTFGYGQGNQHLLSSQIIVATNLAGRGTDIKLDQELIDNGGLHVIITFLPNNNRVEEQAFGRAARNGQPGSGQLIILDKSYEARILESERTISDNIIFNLRMKRKEKEKIRVAEIENYYNEKIIPEEKCFEMLKKYYDALQEKLTLAEGEGRNTKESKVKVGLILRTLLDKWALWLDKNRKEKLDESHIKKLKQILSKIKKADDVLSWFDMPYQYLRLGIQYTKHAESVLKGNRLKKAVKRAYTNDYNEKSLEFLKKAKEIFKKLIKNDKFSDACAEALYYKSYITIKIKRNDLLEESKMKKLSINLLKARSEFVKYSESYKMAHGIIENLKVESKSLIEHKVFFQQQLNLAMLCEQFIESIDNMLGCPITSANIFSNNSADINNILAYDILTHLKKNEILIESRVNPEYDRNMALKIGEMYGLTNLVYLDDLRTMDVTPELLKKRVMIPNLEDFWEKLKKLGILENVNKFIMISTSLLDHLDDTENSDATNPTVSPKKLLDDLPSLEINDEQENVILLHKLHRDHQKYVSDANLAIFKRYFRDLYDYLKKHDVIIENEKARINLERLNASLNSDENDSIVVSDLINLGISTDDASIIIDYLIKRVIRPSSNDPKKYHLTDLPKDVNFLPARLLPHFPSIQELLHKQFIHQRFDANDRLEKSHITDLSITPKEAKKIINLLLNERVIKPSSSDREKYRLIDFPKDYDFLPHCYRIAIQELLDKKFTYQIAYRSLQQLAKNDPYHLKIDLNFDAYNRLFYELIENGILTSTKVNSKNFNLQDKGITQIIEDVHVIRLKKIFKHMHFGTQQIACSNSSKCTKTYAKNHDKIETEPFHLGMDTLKGNSDKNVKKIKELLIRLGCGFKNLESVDCYYEDIKPSEDGEAFLEMAIFRVNSLESLIVLQEQLYSNKMVIKMTLIASFGVAQIIAGALIEAKTCGLMTHTAGFFISEGINDIFFAANSLLSGKCNNYMSYKMQNMAVSAVTAGTCALFSKAAGLQCINRTTYQIAKHGRSAADVVCKRIFSKVSTSMFYGIVQSATDNLLVGRLESYFDGILSEIIEKSESQFNEHPFNDTLERLYVLSMRDGRDQLRASQIIDELSTTILNNQSFNARLFTHMETAGQAFLHGFSEFVNKVNRERSPGWESIILEVLTNSTSAIGVLMATIKTQNIRNQTQAYLDEANEALLKIIEGMSVNTQETDEMATTLGKEQAEKKMLEIRKDVIEMQRSLFRNQVFAPAVSFITNRVAWGAHWTYRRTFKTTGVIPFSDYSRTGTAFAIKKLPTVMPAISALRQINHRSTKFNYGRTISIAGLSKEDRNAFFEIESTMKTILRQFDGNTPDFALFSELYGIEIELSSSKYLYHRQKSHKDLCHKYGYLFTAEDLPVIQKEPISHDLDILSILILKELCELDSFSEIENQVAVGEIDNQLFIAVNLVDLLCRTRSLTKEFCSKIIYKLRPLLWHRQKITFLNLTNQNNSIEDYRNLHPEMQIYRYWHEKDLLNTNKVRTIGTSERPCYHCGYIMHFGGIHYIKPADKNKHDNWRQPLYTEVEVLQEVDLKESFTTKVTRLLGFN